MSRSLASPDDAERYPRLEYLDSTRGVGALIVLLSHFDYAYPRYAWAQHVFNATAAVSLFFVHSGFVLSRKHVGKSEPLTLRLPTYVVGRVARLWLPFAAAMAFAVFGQKWLWQAIEGSPRMSPMFAGRWSALPSIESLVRQLVTFHAPNLVAPSWTLPPELAMSMLLPIAILTIRHSSVWLLVFVTLGFYMKDIDWLLVGMLAVFLLGVVLARYLEEIRARLTPPVKWGIFGACATVYFAVPRSLIPIDPAFFWGVMSFAFLAVVLSSERLQRIGKHPVMAYIGKVSFGIYLLHWPLIAFVTPRTIAALNAHGVGEAVAYWLALLVLVACTMIAASIFYPLVERPSIVGGKRLGRWLTEALS